MDSQQRLEGQELYGAAVGSKADFYAPKFIGFDSYDADGSWNWPAFFARLPWMPYRLSAPSMSGFRLTARSLSFGRVEWRPAHRVDKR